MKACRLLLAVELLIELYGTPIGSVMDNVSKVIDEAVSNVRFTDGTAATCSILRSKVSAVASGVDDTKATFWNLAGATTDAAKIESRHVQVTVEVSYSLNGAETEQLADRLVAIVDMAEAKGLFTVDTTANLRAKDVEVLTLESPDDHDLVLAKAVLDGYPVPHADEAVHRLASQIDPTHRVV